MADIVDFLEKLTPTGIYKIAMVEEVLPLLDITYNRAADRLSYRGQSTKLGAKTAATIRHEMDRETDRVGAIKPGEEGLMVDASVLAEAIHRLVLLGAPLPTQDDPTERYYATVRAISDRLKAN